MVWRAIQSFFNAPSQPTRRPIRRSRLHVECLEERAQPATADLAAVQPANASAIFQGTAFIDANGNNGRDAGEALVPGVTVYLKGTTNQNTAVEVATQTDANGKFTFQNVMPGAYTFRTDPVANLLGGGVPAATAISIPAGQTVTQDVGFRGMAPALVSLRQLLSTPINANFLFGAPGAGTAKAADRENNLPTLKNALGNVSVQSGAADTLIDLAGKFDDQDLTNSVVQFQTNFGNINFELFDRQTPQTVANFFNYINANKFDNMVFNRLVKDFVLQGGGFALGSNPTTLNPIATDPAVQNEFSSTRSNAQWTIAMAKSPNDPNSATSQFFINLANNASNLDSQNGGFTVFGKLQGAADQAIASSIASLTPVNKGPGDPNDPFASFPLKNYTGSNFPTDATAANFVLVNDVVIVKRDESLTYSVTSNSNTNLVTTTIENNRLRLRYNAGQTGSSTITVKATDKFGAATETTFTVRVNAAPTATTDTVTVNAGSNILIDALANDSQSP
ncbi:MAG: peptidylprolyl isomerase, partial [Gemmataceae bacterium]|nr:peptidylprolyl isomerase [Gemmataceae bacterium]